MKKRIILLHILSLFLLQANAQIALSPDSAVQRALKANGHILAKQHELAAQKENIKLAGEISPTQFTWQHGQYNSYVTNDNNFGVSQTLPFPFTMKAKQEAYKALYGESGAALHFAEDQLAFQVRNSCARLVFLQEKSQLFEQQDSLYLALEKAAHLRYTSGDGSFLDWQQALAKHANMQIQLSQLNNELANEKSRLKALMAMDEDFEIVWQEAKPNSITTYTPAENGRLQLMETSLISAEREIKLQKSQFWPSLQVSYFNQSLNGGPTSAELTAPLAVSSDRFQGFGIGLSIPLWAGPQAARIKSAKLIKEAKVVALQQEQREVETTWNNLLGSYILAKENLQNFEQESLPIAQALREQAKLARDQGNISTTEYLLQLNDALALLERYAELNQQIRLLSNQILLINGSN